MTQWTPAPALHDEHERMRRLARLGVGEGQHHDALDHITSLVSSLLDVPMGLVSLVEAKRQFFLSRQQAQTRELLGAKGREGIGSIKHPESLLQAPSERNAALARLRSGPLRPVRAPCRPPKTTVLADRAHRGHTPPVPSRARAALQVLVAVSAPAGGPRADRSSDASTLSVAGGRTSARRTMTLPHVGQARPLTPVGSGAPP